MNRRSGINILFPSIFAFLTLLIIASGWFLWRDVQSDEINQLRNANNLLTSYYELTFNQRELSLLNLGQRLSDLSGPEIEENRLKIINQALDFFDDLSAIGYADTTGQVLALTGLGLNDPLPNLRAMEETNRSFDEVKNSQGMVIGEVYYFNAANDWIIPIRVPIRNSNNLLTSVNTCALKYTKLVENLESFGLPDYYQIHLINDTHNTTQLYYPLERKDYTHILHNSANFYKNVDTLDIKAGQILFTGYNYHTNIPITGISYHSKSLNHNIVITINNNVFQTAFWETFQYALLAYFIFLIITIISYSYFSRTELIYVKELEDEQDYSNRIIQASPAVIIGFNRKFESNFFNPTALRLLGYNKDSVIHKNSLLHMFQSDSVASLPEVILNIFSKPISNEIIEVFDINGNPKSILWNSANTYNKEGEVTETFLFGSDQTEKEQVLLQLRESEKKLQKYSDDLEGLVYNRTQELEEANVALKISNKELQETLTKLKMTQNQLVQNEKMASLGILSAGIGHEINNPLNFIRNGIYALEKELEHDANPEKVSQFIRIINEGVTRASMIVKSLASFSRQADNTNEDCDLEQILNNSLIILQNQLKYKAEVIKTYNHQGVTIKGNSGKLHQAFLNILSNAEQAIESIGVITIETGFTETLIWVAISDSGHGISPEVIDRISDPFFTTKEPGKGTGLGLSITYSIIQEHGGTIKVASEVGKGTTFTVELPKS